MDDRECSTSDWLSTVEKKFEEDISSEGVIDVLPELILNYLFEEAILEVVFEVHRAERTSIQEQCIISEDDAKLYSIIESNDGDIFGQQFVKKSSICRCPRCQRPLSASVFTTHLQNCVGKGRSSARIASLRIANNCIRNAYGGMSDEDDDDWIAGPEKAKKRKLIETKKSQDKNNIRRGKNQNKKKTNKDIVYSENSEEM
ncbi:SAGA-associated factor 11 homolog isoform X2 [Lycorma delicatula]|uniref:SAGA-associated factor 11 homolog isoform X2 n=1 Tax=Lycorma delicatula TaxID=130591 RepID=UPI003F5129B9